MKTTRQLADNRAVASRRRVKWLAAAGLAVSLTIPLSASANHEGDAALNLLIGATVAYALVDAVDGFDNDRNRRRGGDHSNGNSNRGERHHDSDRYFNGHYRQRDKHWRHHLRHRNRHQRSHARRHGIRHGYRHAYGYRPHTYAPHWYAHR